MNDSGKTYGPNGGEWPLYGDLEVSGLAHAQVLAHKLATRYFDTEYVTIEISEAQAHALVDIVGELNIVRFKVSFRAKPGNG